MGTDGPAGVALSDYDALADLFLAEGAVEPPARVPAAPPQPVILAP